MTELAIHRWLSKIDIEPVLTHGATMYWWRDEKVLHINDVFDDVILKFGLSLHPDAKLVISDTYTRYQNSNSIPVHCVPMASAGVVPGLEAEAMKLESDYTTRYCCNFLINKERLNRFYLIKLWQHFVLDRSGIYTYSGIGRDLNGAWCKGYLQDLAHSQSPVDLAYMQQPLDIATQWFETGSTSNGAAWNAGVGDMICSSAVSLITETSFGLEHNTVFTEKTFWSALGLTFPIWIGNSQQANFYQRMGFDIFSDIIDHSYQYQHTLYDRCWRAIHDNLELLTNLDLAKNLRGKYMHRLRHNQNLVMNNDVLTWCRQRIQELPESFAPQWTNFMRENYTPYL